MKLFKLPSCKEVFETRYDLEKRPFLQRFMVKLHLAICKNCQCFEETMILMEDKMKTVLKSKANQVDDQTIEKLKEQIKKGIKSN